MTPMRHLAAELEATLASLVGAYTAVEPFLLLALGLSLAGLLGAVVAPVTRARQRRRRSSFTRAQAPAEHRRHAYLRLMGAASGLVCVACGTPSAATLQQPPADAERAAIADTLRELYRDGSQTFDAAVDCSEIADWLADRAGVLFVAKGELFETGGAADLMAMCQAIKRDRLSAEEEIQEQRVEVLNRDAAVVVTRGVYTVRYKDGRTMVRPQVVTTAWSRGREGWRMVHLHESWP